MVGAFAIRRLREAKKLSSSLPSKSFRAIIYPQRGELPTHLDHDDLGAYYDLTHGRPEQVNLSTLHNQIIHSFVFQFVGNDEGSWCLAVTSDQQRVNQLIVVELEVIANLFDYVGREDILELTIRNEQSKRVSNHDLVESGRATYGDESRLWINERDHLLPEVGTNDLRDLVEGRRTVRREGVGTYPPLPDEGPKDEGPKDERLF
jgi:hypothetical protein